MIDWANVVIGEPAYDVAALRTIALYVDPGVPGWARGAATVARRLMVSRYMSVYRAAVPLQARNLPYYEAIRILSALTFAGRVTSAGRQSLERATHREGAGSAVGSDQRCTRARLMRRCA